jgi:predicted ester cyclase
MGAPENEALARRLMTEVWDKGNLKVLDDVLAATYVDHNPPPGLPSDREGAKQAVTVFRTAFPDLKNTIEDVIAAGDKVVMRIMARGTHKGEFQGVPPSGKPVTFEGVFIGRVSGGKFVESWEQFDALGVLVQLGVVTPPGAGG